MGFAAGPRLAVPAEAVAALARLIFREVEADEGDRLSSILLHHVVARSVHLRRRINSVGVPVARGRWRGRVARRQIRTTLSGHILHSSRRHVLRGTMAHFGMLGRAVGIGRKRHVMAYRSHVGSLLVGSSRLWRAMTHRGMLGRTARSLRLHVHARHTVMIQDRKSVVYGKGV